MRIAVFGLGYVGCVTGACLARLGHTVAGVDISEIKVRMINEGRSPIVEKGMDRLVSRMVRAGRFRATQDPAEAMKSAEVSLITVGTPSAKSGDADLTHVLHAAREIGKNLRGSRRFHTVVARSTVPPGTVRRALLPALERSSGNRAGRDFGLCFHPEFLREGSSVDDFFHPPMNVLGCLDARSGTAPRRLWAAMRAPLVVTSLEAAEMLKYASNAFHAIKVSFANEIGALAKSLGVDSREVMRLFVQDNKLNISPAYLEPGFAFGGSCLPKDLRALIAMSRRARVKIPLLGNVLVSNSEHIRRAARLVIATGKKRVGVLGLVFKSGTDDLRESPACALVKNLLAAGREVRIYDPNVQLDRLVGANRDFVERELPQLSRILAGSLVEVVRFAGVVVLAGNHPAFEKMRLRLRHGQVLISLIRPPSAPEE
jgi:GDP-mannose 6-dehydrogenase